MSYSTYISEKKLNKIPNYKLGGLYKFISVDDREFNKFGEVYFSFVKKNKIKCWKKHNKMKMNVVVPMGSVKFVFKLNDLNNFYEVTIGKNNYKLLTINPGIWFGFKGLSENNMVVNLSDIKHSKTEVSILKKNQINYLNW